MCPILRHYISIITFRDTSVFGMERYIILLRRLRERDVRNCTVPHSTFVLRARFKHAESIRFLNLKLNT